MRRVIIESPYAPQTPLEPALQHEGGASHTNCRRCMRDERRKWELARNLRYLRACLRDSMMRGEAPFASHAIYTQEGVMRDDLPHERKQSIEAGYAWWAGADAIIVYTDLGLSSGMHAAIERAKGREVALEMRQLSGWEA